MTDEDLIVCAKCGKNVKRRELESHVRQELGYYPFRCQHCESRFVSNQTLETHFIFRHEDKPRIVLEDPVMDMELEVRRILKETRDSSFIPPSSQDFKPSLTSSAISSPMNLSKTSNTDASPVLKNEEPTDSKAKLGSNNSSTGSYLSGKIKKERVDDGYDGSAKKPPKEEIKPKAPRTNFVRNFGPEGGIRILSQKKNLPIRPALEMKVLISEIRNKLQVAKNSLIHICGLCEEKVVSFKTDHIFIHIQENTEKPLGEIEKKVIEEYWTKCFPTYPRKPEEEKVSQNKEEKNEQQEEEEDDDEISGLGLVDSSDYSDDSQAMDTKETDSGILAAAIDMSQPMEKPKELLKVKKEPKTVDDSLDTDEAPSNLSSAKKPTTKACAVCGKATAHLTRHVARAHYEGIPHALSCKICDFTARWCLADMKAHFKKKHPNETRENMYEDRKEELKQKFDELKRKCYPA